MLEVKWYKAQSAHLGFSTEEREQFAKLKLYRSDIEAPRTLRRWSKFGVSSLVTKRELDCFKAALPEEILAAKYFDSKVLGIETPTVNHDAPATNVPFWLARLYCLANGGDLPSFEELAIHHRRTLSEHDADIFAIAGKLHELAKSCIVQEHDYYDHWCRSIPQDLCALGFGLFSEYTRSMAVNPGWPPREGDGRLDIPDTDHLSYVSTATGVFSEFPYPGRFGRVDPRWLTNPPGGVFNLTAFRVAFRSMN